MDNINFTPKDILQKEFKPKMRGYDPADVDTFLDSVIKDYENFNKEIERMKNENDRLTDKVDELNKQASVGSTVEESSAPVSGATNVDVLKRLSNLERRVFGAQLEDNGNDSHRI
ncbi:cell division regulator GpsB [Pediococcus stilesii]|uniref:Cell cycle protein GpsB n=1 Tax=Pediococcus stilesii TaxID=331679 RepID=A0A0R2L022_9LACO|nr:cell division regulator GpsB [Pediococcus stilesii]KRN95145.1 cell division protein GpsB [Pediococcus stilesii]TLQ04193.1 cell division regulator GpsB [Pediococcus stilesii]